MNNLYPIFLKIENLKVLLVGGGNVALEKLDSILKSSPKSNITVIAPQIDDRIISLSKKFNLELIVSEYNKSFLENKQIVFVAVNSKELSKSIKLDANKLNLLVNVADNPSLCDFYLGSVVNKGDLKIGISTNGLSPTFSKRFREVLEEILPNNLPETLLNLKKIRDELKGDFSTKVEKLNEITKSLKP